MHYMNIKQAKFIERPNRFVAYANLDGIRVKCHVKNTGRCKELLVPDAEIYLEDHGDRKDRKTRYSIVKVKKGDRLINMDSLAPNEVALEWMLKGGLYKDIICLKREQKYGASRFDFYYERKNGKKGFVEVKGVTLEEGNVAKFPDAPTLRGMKHIQELEQACADGYEANIIFVIQMEGVACFEPNYDTHREFGEALQRAKSKGVNILAVDCHVTETELEINTKVHIRF